MLARISCHKSPIRFICNYLKNSLVFTLIFPDKFQGCPWTSYVQTKYRIQHWLSTVLSKTAYKVVGIA